MQIDTCEIRRWIEDRRAALKTFYTSAYRNNDDEKCKFAIDELCGDLINLLDDYEDSLGKDTASQFDRETDVSIRAVKANAQITDFFLNAVLGAK